MDPLETNPPVPSIEETILRGIILLEQNDVKAARKVFEDAITLAPDRADLLHFSGVALLRSGEVQAGIDRMVQSLSAPGGSERSDFFLNLGAALRQLNQSESAFRVLDDAVARFPNDAAMRRSAGGAAMDIQSFEAARAHFLHATEIDPNQAEYWSNLGHANRQLNDHENALIAFRTAAGLTPDDAAAWNNVGVTLKELGRLDEAIICYQDLLSKAPNQPPVLYNLANAYTDARQYAAAAEACEHLLMIDPDHVAAHVQLAFSYLNIGRYQDGFREYDWRFKAPGFPAPPYQLETPPWDGSPLNGKRILLISEQGFGDTLQFIRYAPMVKAAGGTVIVECHTPLAPLLRGQPGIDAVVPRSHIESGGSVTFDCHIHTMSLPGVFNTTPTTMPNACPYLHVPPFAKGKFHSVEALQSSDLKVGLVWQGSQANPNDSVRSLPPQHLATLLDTPGVQWVSLNKRDADDERPNNGLPSNAVDLSDAIENFADSAAIIDALDAVIAVDTAVGHLAGAMGKPVFVILPYNPDWRWAKHDHIPDDQSAWYPTMHLFRKDAPNDWQAPIERCKAALRNLMTGLAKP